MDRMGLAFLNFVTCEQTFRLCRDLFVEFSEIMIYYLGFKENSIKTLSTLLEFLSNLSVNFRSKQLK